MGFMTSQNDTPSTDETGPSEAGRKGSPNFDHPEIDTEETLDRHETIVEGGFLLKFRQVLGKLPFAEEMAAAYYCAMDKETPPRVRGILMAALAYFVMPADMIPDIVTGFGFTDDATVIATAIAIVGGHIKTPHHDKAKAFLLHEDKE
jgi:uncharacterized membrane protein YkvA (DUF1232 family)